MLFGMKPKNGITNLIKELQSIIYKYGYLLITAAWLYTLSFIFTNYWSYHASPERVKETLQERIHKQEKAIAVLMNDTATLFHLLHQDSTDLLRANRAERFGFFIYQRAQEPQLVYWNTNKMYLPIEQVAGLPGEHFIVNPNGSFIVIKKERFVREKRYYLIAVIPVRWSYFIENKYFHTDFADYPGLDDQYEISEHKTALPVVSSSSTILFRIQLKDGKAFIAYDAVTIILRVIAIIFLLIFLHAAAEELCVKRSVTEGFGFLLVTVICIRLLAYTTTFPFDTTKLPLFDPSIYASNFLHPSLGDLLVNAILFFWLIIFYRKNSSTIIFFSTRISSNLLHFFRIIIFAWSCFIINAIIISLVQDAKISFDVTNFFSLTIYTTLSFVVLCFLTLSFFYLSQIVLCPILADKPHPLRIFIYLLVAALLYLVFFVKTSDTLIYICISVWLIGYLILFWVRHTDLNVPLIKSPFFIFWVMLFAVSIAALVMYQNRLVEGKQRKRIAEKLAIQADPSGENLLNIAATNFSDGFLANNFNRFTENEYVNKFIKDSLINQNFSGYLNKFDTRIYTFDSLFHPLFNEDSLNYSSIKTIVLNQATPTDVANLYRYENVNDGFSYIYQRTAQKGNTVLGYFFILLESKRYKSEALYPELFNQSEDIATDLNTNYAYAVYANKKIINHFNNYDFPTVLTDTYIPNFEFVFKQVGDYSELWYNSGGNKQVVVVKRNTWLLESITLFAYLFCSFLIIIFLFHMGGVIVKARLRWGGIQQLFVLNIRSQIQATIIFLSVFSFIVIGVATISFFIYRFNTSNEERLSKSIQVMANELNAKVNSLIAFDDLPDNPGVQYEIEKIISDISDQHNVDINYYNAAGDLLASTQPYIYNKHLLSSKMEPQAYFELKQKNKIRFLQSEKIGTFQYLSVYVPLTDQNNNRYAYLNIPYLNSQLELNQEISGFLATLINLNAFIFLLAGAIAFFLTSRIIQSLQIIGETMQKMVPGQKNEEIIWPRNDEIGVLVTEYNSMVRKLEASMQSLAKSEREGAWREMARQVAHEIKNPLTPMKLSLQYLQKAIANDANNVKELSAKMAGTLIEQIDQLAKIASDFSQFANIGNAKMEQFNVQDTIDAVVALFASSERVIFNVVKAEGEATIVLADKIQMNRLFTNLIQNGIEAAEEKGDRAFIDIHTSIENNNIKIVIEDQSGGIPEQVVPHIFSPNFTTKNSGTGLGLAICKGIVEKAEGTISFRSIQGKGTVFTILLPHIKL